MTDYTAAEIEKAVDEDAYFGWNYQTKITLRGEQVDVEWVDSTGGMDEGSYASAVFKVGDQLFKKTGFYASHYGYDWDGDLFQVEPYEKTVVDYRRV